MKITEFVDVVTRMRHYQKEYFRPRTDEALIRSKELEAQVDQMIYDYNQPSLFNPKK